MIRSKNEIADRGIELDLTGPDGNAFRLIGVAKRLGRELGYSDRKVEGIVKKMTDGNYESLVQTFEAVFGQHVTLYR